MEDNSRLFRLIEFAGQELAVQIGERHYMKFAVVESALGDILQGLNMLGDVGFEVRVGSPEDAKLRLVARSFNSIHVALWAAKRGYFQQASALVRMVYEDQLIAGDIDGHPETLEALFDEQKMFRGDLSFPSMAGRFSDKARETWDKNYGDLSRHGAHPRAASMATVIRLEGGKPIYDIGGRYDSLQTLWFFQELLGQLIHMFNRLAEVTTDAGIDWANQATATLQLVVSLYKAIDQWAEEEGDTDPPET